MGGHHNLFFPAKDVTSCGRSAHEPAAKEYDIFLAQLKQRTKLLYEKPVVVKDLKLNRYILDKSLVAVNNRTVFSPGLLDMSGLYGFPTLLGFPRFLHGERGMRQKLGLPKAHPETHGSFVSLFIFPEGLISF